jgi:hypothetical protein
MTRNEMFMEMRLHCTQLRDGAWMEDEAVRRAYAVWCRAGKPVFTVIRWWHMDPVTLKHGEVIKLVPVQRRHTPLRVAAESVLLARQQHKLDELAWKKHQERYNQETPDDR